MKTAIVKLAGAIVLIFITVQFVSAQFTGKLVYESDQRESKLVMTYYQDKNHARMEAYSMHLAQDTIIYDLSKATETHLQYRAQNALIMQYIDAGANQVLKNQQINVQKMGQETVNGYSCTHYVITNSRNGRSNKGEVWITKDLGPAPSIYVMGGYLYYTPGYLLLTKLIEAGGDGIVVKAVHGEGANIATVNLISIDKNMPSAALFQVPSRYTVMDRTNITMPTKPLH